jgi:NlpC/P60 family putative phage cell wall peptidase
LDRGLTRKPTYLPGIGTSPNNGALVGERRRVIAEAEDWLGTPYHHMGRLKGVGCDCLTLLAGVYHASGLIPALDIPFYPPDWHLHRSAERYISGLVRHACEVEAAKPGDVALFKFGRCFSHGAIVTGWPHLIHAWHAGGVIRGDATQPLLAGRPVRFFSPFFDNQTAPK